MYDAIPLLYMRVSLLGRAAVALAAALLLAPSPSIAATAAAGLSASAPPAWTTPLAPDLTAGDRPSSRDGLWLPQDVAQVHYTRVKAG